MSRSIVFGLLMGGVLLVATTSRSDVATDTSASAPAPTVAEPTLEAPVAPAAGDEVTAKDPFAPYDVGGPDAAWTRADLSPDEQAAADHGIDVKGWARTHGVFGSAVAERSKQAVGDAAQHQLGIDEIAGTGVVP